ncbi:MAG TPA: hypothetical protein VMV91_04640 [Rhodocyclaceae bacterium]|nr:hypothetical protein [Rhodocyclaceae bacterium]
MEKIKTRNPWRPDLMTILYIAAIVKLAALPGAAYILFPELGALAKDVFSRPRGNWALAPLLLVLTPSLAAVIGVLIAQHLAYGLISVLLATATGIAVIVLLRSPIAPAISAGLLPLAFDIHSWWYPPAIALGTALLAGLSVLRRRYGQPPIQILAADLADDIVELPPRRYRWLPFFVAFVAIDVSLGQALGWRAVLVPPLVVTGFEMFAHAEVCPWAQRSLVLPLVCVLTAALGAASVAWLGTGPFAAAVAVAGGIAILAAFDLHVPPAIAIGLLPLLLEHPDYRYPLAVGLGAVVLTLSFRLYRFVLSAVNSRNAKMAR